MKKNTKKVVKKVARTKDQKWSDKMDKELKKMFKEDRFVCIGERGDNMFISGNASPAFLMKAVGALIRTANDL